ncbi:hypothetical protein AB0C64_44785, partial [Streptomyces sp900116325]
MESPSSRVVKPGRRKSTHAVLADDPNTDGSAIKAGRLGRFTKRTWQAGLIGWKAAPANLSANLLLTVVGGAAPALLAWLTKLLIDNLMHPGNSSELRALHWAA